MEKFLSMDNPVFLHLALEHLGTFAILNQEGNYIYASKLWAQRVGCNPQQALGRHVTEFFPNTKALEAMEKKAPILAYPIQISAESEEKQFTSYIPLIQDDVAIGCIIQTIFHNMHEALEFSNVFNKMRGERNYYRQELQKLQGSKYAIDNIIGNSKQILAVKNSIRLAANSISNVLIEGETGCGKELVAHSIHTLSIRSVKPIIKLNCAAIPVELAESELFGYEYGAFTGAKAGGKIGKFEMANQGTLFLDEINQLSPLIQPKLLRVLQEKELEHVGGTKSIQLNVRLIAATNVPLEELIAENLFRSDLYYRLNVINIRIPPLRERLEDIPVLVEDSIIKLNGQLGTMVEGVTDDVMAKFQNYTWPGNVRELQNVLERAMNSKLSGVIPWYFFADYFTPRRLNGTTHNSMRNYRVAKKQEERIIVLEALENEGGNKKRAADTLGISRTMLYRKLKEYGYGAPSKFKEAQSNR
jgi:transcriptional regulator with PAS, ATPase and Fis domain